jgi:hypothetical protein
MSGDADLGPEASRILQELNPWWETGALRQGPHSFRRRGVDALITRLARPRGLIEIVRGPRQVGKTTALEQVIGALLSGGVSPTDILFINFDQEVLRDHSGGLLRIVRWFCSRVRRRPFESGATSYLLLDEVHKLPRWAEDVKHLGDTFPIRIVLTGSSSTLVARGGRESLAGRVLTTELPTFRFREVLEAWAPIGEKLPPLHPVEHLLEHPPREIFEPFRVLRPQQRLALRRSLERYYNRGGYPRLYNGDVSDDEWADYLSGTIIDRVLGVDVPDLFPVRNPRLLRWVYVEIARSTGQEISQNRLAEFANQAGFRTSQPIVGNYMHYLADALLIREFRRYPLAKRESSRTPSKITLTDLGARNAIFRGAPSLWESAPDVVSPLIETLVQSVLRGSGIEAHFFRDYQDPKNPKSPVREVDFVLEDRVGRVVPIEVKFRKKLDSKDFLGLSTFMKRFGVKSGVLVTLDSWEWSPESGILCVPLLDFLLAF